MFAPQLSSRNQPICKLRLVTWADGNLLGQKDRDALIRHLASLVSTTSAPHVEFGMEITWGA